jgi:uncharacterized protein
VAGRGACASLWPPGPPILQGMAFHAPPAFAAWQHRDARVGFEVVFLYPDGDGYRVEGETCAVEDCNAWAVQYVIGLGPRWTTGSARVVGRSAAGRRERRLDADGAGCWRIDGAAIPELDGCLDVDLESSALTNAFPVRRLGLEIGQGAEPPSAYVRAVDLSVERLEQRYVRLDDDGRRQCYAYSASRFGVECVLVYDEDGLVVDYPGIALRAGA